MTFIHINKQGVKDTPRHSVHSKSKYLETDLGIHFRLDTAALSTTVNCTWRVDTTAAEEATPSWTTSSASTLTRTSG